MKPSVQSFLRYPLDRVFESPANVRVLRVLARHGGEMTIGMMMDQAALTRMSVLAAVRRLADSGLVDVVGNGRQRLNRFNEKNPLSAAVKDLFAAESARYTDTIRSIQVTSRRLGAEAVWIFGSVARGQDRSDSDIDIAVAIRPRAGAAVEGRLREKLRQIENATTSVIVVDAPLIARLEREQDPWWVALKRDAVTVTGVAPEEYLRWARRHETKGNNDANRKRKKGRS
jgi:predicted nucleotidyltransferase